jgi:ribosomal protein S18 acetylase RimI-like enzyme
MRALETSNPAAPSHPAPIPSQFTIRGARTAEYQALGELIVEVYSQLPGFPRRAEQPVYYELMADIGRFMARPSVRVLVAVSEHELVGGVVYFSAMTEYASGGAAPLLTHTSGIRFLAVAPRFQGSGAGKALTLACIDLARRHAHTQVVLHTTAAMLTAWRLYERLGFVRAAELDFLQQDMPVFGFRLHL